MIKRKTHEQFVEEIKIKHPHIKIIGEYKKSKDRILCECLKDGYQWSPTACSLSAGYGCPKCSGNNKKTHDEFIDELKKINQDIEVIGKYVNSTTKILCKCKIDGFEWNVKPSNLLHLHRGCPECAKRGTSNRMNLSYEEFLERLDKYNKINNTFWYTEDIYQNNRTPMKFMCKNDGFSIVAKPSNLFSGYYKCKECDRDIKEKALKEHVQTNNLPIEIIGKYINNRTKIKCRCTLCNKEYFTTPNSILSTNAICRDCAYIEMGVNSRVSLDEFLLRLKENNPEIEYISGYEGMSKRVNVSCKKCNHKWNPIAGGLVNEGKGCPSCSSSKGEKKIEEILKNENINYTIQKTFDGLVGVGNTKIRYDFYLPKHNLLIEYQGIQHEKPIDFSGRGEDFAIKCFENQQEHDNRKREYAKKNNIKLLEIWYYDFDNIENILKSHLVA